MACNSEMEENETTNQIAFTHPITILLKPILFVSMNTLTILMFWTGSDQVEIMSLIFNGLPNPSSAFDAFVLSITFAFSAALGALLITHKPNLANFYAFSSLASMASALLLLIWGLSSSLIYAKVQCNFDVITL